MDPRVDRPPAARDDDDADAVGAARPGANTVSVGSEMLRRNVVSTASPAAPGSATSSPTPSIGVGGPSGHRSMMISASWTAAVVTATCSRPLRRTGRAEITVFCSPVLRRHRSHEVAGVQRGQRLGLARREAEAGEPRAAAVVHVVLQRLHGAPAGGDRRPASRRRRRAARGVEDLVVETGGGAQRVVASLDGAGEARPRGSGSRPAWRSRWPSANATWRASSLRVRWAMRRVSGSGAWRSRKPSSDDEACPRPSPRAGRRRWRSRARRAGSAATPGRRRSTGRVAARRSAARRVNTSMWRASSATVIASTCWISRKCGWIWPRKRAGTTSAASSFSMRKVITCTTASSIVGGVGRSARPVDRGVGVPLGGGRLGVQAAARSVQTSSRWSRANVGVGPARLDRAHRARPDPSRPAGAATRASAAGSTSPARSAPTSRDPAVGPRSTTTPAADRAASAEPQPMALLPAPRGELADEVGVRPPHRDAGARRHVARASLTRTCAPPSKPSAPRSTVGAAVNAAAVRR